MYYLMRLFDVLMYIYFKLFNQNSYIKCTDSDLFNIVLYTMYIINY